MGTSTPKLGFTIISCSGEDADFPVSGLLSKDPQVKGWQTPRFCKWPQQVTLQLEGLAHVQQIQILSHEYKIASKVELYVGTQGGGDAITWKRLGSFSFDSNERSKLQARELKSVTLSVQALYVRIVLARCHANTQNAYSQAGLLGVSIAGDLIRRSSDAQLQAVAAPPAEPAGQVPAGSSVAAATGPSGADAKTATRLAELESTKARAVAEEDYDEAKRLKLEIDRLRALVAQLSDLEAKKKAAVEAEDYDTAKALKQNIERLRLAGEASSSGGTASGQPGGPSGGSNGFGHDNPSARNQEQSALNGGMGGRMEQPMLSPSSYSNHDETPISPMGTTIESQPHGKRKAFHIAGRLSIQDEGPGRLSIQDEVPGAVASSRRASSTPSQAYDERPAVARGSYTAAAAAPPAAAPAARALNMERASAAAADSAGPPPVGWPGDLPQPEPLSAADAKEASDLSGVLEEFLVRCLFSKNWQLREAALQYLEKRLSGQELASDAKRDLARSLGPAFRLALTDKVPGVYLAGLSLLRAVTQPGVVAPRECASLASDLAPLLIEKAGENNARVQAAAVDTLLALAQLKDAALSSLASLFLKPEKATQWKRVLGRLQLLEALIPVFGIGKGDGFSLEPLMKFVGATLGNANADVRAAATRITVLVHSLVGAHVRKHLPAGLNPKILEQLEADFAAQPASPAAAAGGPSGGRGTDGSGTPLGGGGRNAPARPTSPPVPAVALRLSGAAASPAAPPRNGKTAGAADRNGQAAAAEARNGKAAAGESRNSKAAAAAAPVTVMASAHASSHYSLADAYPVDPPSYHDASEEAIHEAELRRREAILGPNRPEVAESLSNLAILYNTRGDYDRAQPLYERALRIYEAEYGPDSTEVAHTLTDLAVLHLEQGNDDEGRPLLQKALYIQEAALGPNHPDVQAIRDVLEGEED
ncbi:Centrosomal protein of 104 kDa [Coccomyxa sp. Obi]|nr:Centrosomal protein of 104 kDa [Coccomyxa sp. Obi]